MSDGDTPIDITFTHRGWFYGCPVWIAFEGDHGIFPAPMVPGTGWWITGIAPLIQETRAYLAGIFNIDTPEIDRFAVWVKPLARPKVKRFWWDADAVECYRTGR